ncbi:hypothetical protein E2320_002590 [Naja naja]|nr:hypothetical protein E2320_002590 [Naja naja]
MQDEVMKALETKNQFGSLRKLISDEFVNTKQAVENLLENLDTLANLPQMAHKTKIAEREEEAQELEVKIENLLTYLILGSRSRISADNSKTFNELLPDKALSHETHCEHQKQTTSAPPSPDFLPDSDDSDLFEAVLTQSNPHEYLDEMGSNEKLLKKLYKSSNVLQVAPKAKMTRNEGTQTLEVQKDLTSEILEVSSDIRLRPKSHLQGLKNHQNTIQRDHWLQIRKSKGKTHELEIQKETRTDISETLSEIRLKTKNPVKRLKWHQRKIQEDLEVGRNEREKTGKPVALLDAQEVSSLKRLAQASVHSLQKRSILHLPTQLPPLTSFVVHDGGEEQPGKVVFVLKSTKRSTRPSHVKNIGIGEQAKETNAQNEQIAEKRLAKQLKSQESRKEKLLRHLIITGSNSRITTEESAILKKLLPNEPYWKHHGHSTSAPPSFYFLSTSKNVLLRNYAFESEWKKTLASIFPNKILRNIIAKFMRVLKIDCKKPITKKSCPELIHKMGRFLVKFTTSAEMERLSARKTLPARNENNIPSTSSIKMEMPPHKIAKQRMLQRIGRNGKFIYILLALSVTIFIMIIIAVPFIIKTSASEFEKPLWFKDMYQPIDEVKKKHD